MRSDTIRHKPGWNSINIESEKWGNSQPSIRTARAAQLPLMIPPPAASIGTAEPKGVVFTKRWVVELLLDLAGYTAGANLVDAVAGDKRPEAQITRPAGDLSFRRFVAAQRGHVVTFLGSQKK